MHNLYQPETTAFMLKIFPNSVILQNNSCHATVLQLSKFGFPNCLRILQIDAFTLGIDQVLLMLSFSQLAFKPVLFTRAC